VITLVLGFQQVAHKKNANTFRNIAIGLLVMQAVVSIAVFASDPLFPLASYLLGVTIVCHHAVIHRDSDFSEETCSCAAFQLKNVSNHETWVVASIVAGLISGFHV
jgi:xanthine/uracil permease